MGQMLLVVAVVLLIGLGHWSHAAPLPHPRSAHAVVVEKSSIYVLGGPSTSAVDRFDGKRWRRETTLPGGKLNAPAAVSLGGKIYVIGGFSGSSNAPVSTVRVYDTASRRWTKAPPLPAPRGGHAAVVLDGKIHVIGGGNSESTIADHSVYDPATGAWSEAAPLPRAEGSPAAVVFRDKLYVIGGRSGTTDYGDVFVYDAASDTWSHGPAIPPRGTAGAAVFHDAIYVFGGESQARFKTLREVYRLSAGAASWKRVTQLPNARNYARAVVFRNAVYVVGGSRTPGDSHGSYGSRLVDRFTG
jgi:N-acetylneuraminic acid mutarotase